MAPVPTQAAASAPVAGDVHISEKDVKEPKAGGVTSKKMHSQVVIIGSGPAGHTAAIYLARANLKPVLFEGFMALGVAAGGQLTTTTDATRNEEKGRTFPLPGIRTPGSSEMKQAALAAIASQCRGNGQRPVPLFEYVNTDKPAAAALKRNTDGDKGLEKVENFPGFPDGIGGSEMMDKFRLQSERFGTTIITETVSKLDLSMRPFKYWREGEEDDETAFETADTIIMATGASAKRMNLPGEEEYWQSGISACAVCDGAVPIFRNKPLAVIGGGDSAAEEATYLTKYASHVYVLVRRGELRASKIMAKRLTAHPKVTVLWHTAAEECKGDGDLLQSLTIRDLQTNETRDLPVNGLFYAIGHEPATNLVKGQIETDSDGYIRTIPGTAQTSIKGVFAAGDVQDKKYRQAITSAGSGCMAALEAERLISEEEAEDDHIPIEEKHIPSDALTGYLGADKQ
ncbi:hypothetical protein QFC22_000656 [Naganishia vaughanmartiniae]|uniref:Uncharacterized protein n=1 Tax=Naganishia vaughanmartiniae TaxID=1424756 RepID=A0ACC2XNW2_9TREE|nr:hypothetical protein QFC22_000656 [Naganishia vaughanmartiniae]